MTMIEKKLPLLAVLAIALVTSAASADPVAIPRARTLPRHAVQAPKARFATQSRKPRPVPPASKGCQRRELEQGRGFVVVCSGGAL